MPADSWIVPDDVPALAAEAEARIDGTLSRLTASERDAFWASVRKCYNTPYNDPKPRALPQVTVPDFSEAMKGRDFEAQDLKPRDMTGKEEATSLAALAAPALAAVMAALPGAFPAETHAA
ncbi:hypothetical protein [Methylobacterium sp.]|uniref:hypothetical protein n=1 Tax=Methylobacterium sp. TaxID=409 RepID=UPI002630BFA9|nr:hypothetical protein [Methylobacterium sp.]MDB5647966.1 hypothetical protein [Methylobacterium sp.]